VRGARGIAEGAKDVQRKQTQEQHASKPEWGGAQFPDATAPGNRITHKKERENTQTNGG